MVQGPCQHYSDILHVNMRTVHTLVCENGGIIHVGIPENYD